MLQSYNRYAYVMNNPLNLTDPSGYRWSFKKIFRAAVAIAVAIYAPQYIASFLQSAAPLGGAFVSGGTMITAGGLQAAGLSTLGSMVSGALAGFASGAIASGSLQGGLQGALSGGVFGGIGAAGSAGGWSSSAMVAAHAAGGCITSVAGGGSCGSGAASAAFGKFTTLAIGDMQGDFTKGVATVVAGGVGSVIAGGKFENGAVTAAYGYLFNNCLNLPGGCRGFAERALSTFVDSIKSALYPIQFGANAGFTAAIGAGAAYDIGPVVSNQGNCAVMQNICMVAGPIAGYSFDRTLLSVSSGTPSDGWALSLINKGAAPLLGGYQISGGYGSDDPQAQIGISRGQIAGSALKFCMQRKIAECN